MEIKLHTEAKLKHHFLVKLPLSIISLCTINGKQMKFTLEPRINAFYLVVESLPVTNSELKILFKRQVTKIKYDRKVSLGQILNITYEGFTVTEVEDREELTKKIEIQENLVKLGLKDTISTGNHTLFLKGKIDKTTFYIPIDIIVHKKIEIETGGDVIGKEPNYQVSVKVTNWQNEVLRGNLQVDILGKKEERLITIKKGEKITWNINLGKKELYLANLGKNFLNINLNNENHFRKEFVIIRPFTENKTLKREIKSKLIHLDLSKYYSHNFKEFLQLRQSLDNNVYKPDGAFLSEIKSRQKLICHKDSGVSFCINGRRLCAIYHTNNFKIPIGMETEKIYLLTVSYLTAEDTYSKVGEIEWRYDSKFKEKIDLQIPGNINWGYYYRGYETSLRWTKGLSIVYPNTVLDVIELLPNLQKPIIDITISTHGLRPVIGLLGLTIISNHKSNLS